MNSVRDLFEDPQIKARENIVAVPDPRLGTRPHARRRAAPHGHARDDPARRSPELGRDNEEIYLGRLGLERAEYDRLRAAGVV